MPNHSTFAAQGLPPIPTGNDSNQEASMERDAIVNWPGLMEDFSNATPQQFGEFPSSHSVSTERLSIPAASSEEKTLPESAPISIHDLIAVQSALGAFELPGPVREQIRAQFYYKNIVESISLLANGAITDDTKILVVDTFLVLFYITQCFQDQKELWELLVAKAERWIATRVPSHLRKQIRKAVMQYWKRQATTGGEGGWGEGEK